MTQAQYIIHRKLNILELGQTLGNISEACCKLGVNRQPYYDIKQAIEKEAWKGSWRRAAGCPGSAIAWPPI